MSCCPHLERFLSNTPASQRQYSLVEKEMNVAIIVIRRRQENNAVQYQRIHLQHFTVHGGVPCQSYQSGSVLDFPCIK